MQYVLLHESQKRIRIHLPQLRLKYDQADLLEYYLNAQDSIAKATVNDRTADATILFEEENGKDSFPSLMQAFSYTDEKILELAPEHSSREMNAYYQEKLTFLVLGKAFRRVFFPAPLNMVWTIATSLKFIKQGLSSLFHGHLSVDVLDATAITASMLRSDFATAASVMFLLDMGDILEEWTHRKSVDDLARTMSLNVDKVWLKTDGQEDILVDVKDVQVGDQISIGTSNVIPLDGKVVDGEMMVNQASMTGESVPVRKTIGGYVYAGTVVEEGTATVEVTKAAGTGKYDQIVKMIEESEKLKSNTEEKAFHLADRLVPYSLVGSALTYLLTRNVNKALSFLMVDYSCALKLSMPLSVLSAIREAGEFHISVKGGKYLEAVADADTIVFDKTGTLTHASPSVVDIITFDKMDETESLRVAACLEEHYPHSIANAVVAEAKKRNIKHDEMHTKVEYVIAHGISSSINGKKAIIGSYHFVFEDEKCIVPDDQKYKLETLPSEYSHLYLAIDGVLQAVICIFDPLREEAADVITKLHNTGLKVCMMTGDNERTAHAIAEKLNLDEYHAEVLPEDKAEFIKAEHEKGHKVIMVGDGVNDAPALSEADCGIAISDGAAIAREISDITISSDSLQQVLILRQLSSALMKRIHSNYRFILVFNSSLIALGVIGILQPSSSALLHNGSTVITGLRSMTNVVPVEQLEG